MRAIGSCVNELTLAVWIKGLFVPKQCTCNRMSMKFILNLLYDTISGYAIGSNIFHVFPTIKSCCRPNYESSRSIRTALPPRTS
jgi:hypothetical protein